MSNKVNPNNGQEEIVEKTMAERAKEVGRDGAYLELDASDMVSACKNGDLDKAKIIVIKNSRLELSNLEGQVIPLVRKIEEAIKSSSSDDKSEFFGMTNEQIGFCLFNKILWAGLNV